MATVRCACHAKDVLCATQCTDNHTTCCRCAVALRVSNDSTDAAWRNAGTPRPLVCAALYRRTAAAHSCPPLLVCQSSMDQDFEIYNECIEQSGEPDIENRNSTGVLVAICLTLACLSAGGGDLILPEVFTRVCMAKQLIPGQGPQYVRKVSTDTTCSEWWRGWCMGLFLVVGL